MTVTRSKSSLAINSKPSSRFSSILFSKPASFKILEIALVFSSKLCLIPPVNFNFVTIIMSDTNQFNLDNHNFKPFIV